MYIDVSPEIGLPLSISFVSIGLLLLFIIIIIIMVIIIIIQLLTHV